MAAVRSVVLDALTRRLAELAVRAAGPPPVPFTWFALGSLARRETVPSSDVDSALAWEGDGGEAEEQVVEGTLGVGACDECCRRLADVDVAWCFGVGGRGENVVDGVDLAGLCSHIDLGRMSVEVEVALCGGESNQDAAVDLGREDRRAQDPGDIEPHASGPDPLAAEDAVDPE